MRRLILISLLSFGTVAGYAAEVFSFGCRTSCHSRG